MTLREPYGYILNIDRGPYIYYNGSLLGDQTGDSILISSNMLMGKNMANIKIYRFVHHHQLVRKIMIVTTRNSDDG